MRDPYGEDNPYKTEYVAGLLKYCDSPQYKPDDIEDDLGLSFKTPQGKSGIDRLKKSKVTICKWCLVKFYPDHGAKLYCCSSCAQAANKAASKKSYLMRNKRSAREVECVVCKEIFFSKLSTAKTCSKKCRVYHKDNWKKFRDAGLTNPRSRLDVKVYTHEPKSNQSHEMGI